MSRCVPQIRYRCPTAGGPPPIGAIIMSKGPRARCGYRVLGAVKTKSAMVMVGITTWRVSVERMSVAAAREEVAAGAAHWEIVWDKRS